MSEPQRALAPSQPLVPSGVLGLVLFIATEALFFAGLISAFLVLRAEAMAWPPLDQPRLPVALTGFNTFLLLVSGWTIQRALSSLRRGELFVRDVERSHEAPVEVRLRTGGAEPGESFERGVRRAASEAVARSRHTSSWRKARRTAASKSSNFGNSMVCLRSSD